MPASDPKLLPLYKSLKRRSSELRPKSVVMTLSRLSRGVSRPPPFVVPSLCGSARSLAGSMSATEVANLFRGLSNLELRNDELLRALSARALPIVDKLSSQHITMILHACANLPHHDPDLVEFLTHAATKILYTFKPQELSGSLLALSKLSYQSIDRQFLMSLCAASESHLPSFNAQSVANACTALSHLPPLTSPSLLLALQTRAANILDTFLPQNVAAVLNAMSKLGCDNHRFLDDLCAKATTDLKHFNATELALALNSQTKFNYRRDLDFVKSICVEMSSKVNQLTPQGLSLTFNALGRLNYYDSDLVSSLCLAASRPAVVAALTPQGESTILHALARLYHYDAALLALLCGKLATSPRSEESNQSVANSIHSFAVLSHFDRPSLEALLSFVFSAPETSWIEEELLQLHFARVVFALEHEAPVFPPRLERLLSAAASRAGPSPYAGGQDVVADVLAVLRSLKVEHDVGADVGGLGVEVSIRGAKTVLEVTGPQDFLVDPTCKIRHLTGLRKCRERLLERQGYTVLRVSASDWSSFPDHDSKERFLKLLLTRDGGEPAYLWSTYNWF